MSTAGMASIWATATPTVGKHSWVLTIAALVIIPISVIVRMRRGRSSPEALYTPATTDPDPGQDPLASGFPDEFGAVAYDPTLPPSPAPGLPTFTYGYGTHSAAVIESAVPPDGSTKAT